MIARPALILAAVAAIAASGCGKSARKQQPERRTEDQKQAPPPVAPADAGPRRVVLPPAPPVPATPRGLPDTPAPLDNPTTADKVALGRLLFFDPRLAADRAASCATCHDPDHGWADGVARDDPVRGKPNLRHTPSLYDVAYARSLYWDGRQDKLEDLLPGHWEGQLAGDPEAVAAALAAIPEYRAHFQRSFGGPPSPAGVVDALAAFVRTLRSGDSPFDRYEVAGDRSAVSADAIAGFRVFSNKAQCALCHAPPLYTDSLYHAIESGKTPDPGRALVTGRDSDLGAFRTPTLRGVTRTAPYFHDGRAPTLLEAVVTCLQASRGPAHPVILTPTELDQLLAFLDALTPPATPYQRPKLPADPK